MKDVGEWLGNSAPIIMQHYAMQRADKFTRACVRGVTRGRSDEASESDTAVRHTKGAQPAPNGNHESVELAEKANKTSVSEGKKWAILDSNQ